MQIQPRPRMADAAAQPTLAARAQSLWRSARALGLRAVGTYVVLGAFAVGLVGTGSLALAPLLSSPVGADSVAIIEEQERFSPMSGADLEMEPEPASLANVRGSRIASGPASFYGSEFEGRPTANGERFRPDAMTAAHRTLPFGSKVKVTNLRNGRSVVVRINDRGPFHGNRVIDLSKAAARELGFVRSGTAPVEIELLPVRS